MLKALFLVALLATLWALDHVLIENRGLSERVGMLERDASRDQQLITDQAKALAGQQALQGQLTKISAATRQLEQAVTRQAERLARDLEELKRTDETVEPYLRSLVPVAVGLRYERPETTDPLAYRQAGSVRAGPVPTIGTPGPGHE